MRFPAVFCFVLISFLAAGQTARISGRIIDSETNEPLPFANIFLNHTTLGTAADEKGFFQLNNIPPGQVEIIFSFVGYQPYQMKVFLINNQSLELTTKLLQDKVLLENVSVQSTRDEKWEDQLKKFTSIFLGETKGALSCKIVNPWVLDFKEGVAGSNNVLFAEASEPIIIENLYLGYNISYFLKRFTVNAETLVIQGNVRFDEMGTTDFRLARKWDENRLRAYNESPRHLFYSILTHRLSAEGFRLYFDKPGFANSMVKSESFSKELGKSVEELDSSQMEILSGLRQGELQLVLKKRIEVHYLKGRARSRTYHDVDFPVSWIDFKYGTINVDPRGNPMDPENMVTDGQMNKARISELLPYDYEPLRTVAVLQKNDTIRASRWKELQEQVYLTTDKPYYYPGEMIWFKAFMRYSNPEKMDTLSRVLHVELIGSDKKIVQSKEYFIDRGMSSGDLLLNETLSPGPYYIRAYTQWMHNYGEGNFFLKQLPILSLYDKVLPVPSTVHPVSDNVSVEIALDKETYLTREKISMIVRVNDEEGLPMPFDLSVSVVDAELVTPLAKAQTIVDELSKQKDSSPGDVKATYPIEYGISLNGQVKSKNQKKEKFIVTIVQGNNEDIGAVDTDPDGKFYLSGFQFTDSVEFAFQSKNIKGKTTGTVELAERQPLPLVDLPAPIVLPLQKKANPQRVILHSNDSSRILEDVIVKSTRLESDYNVMRHVQPDYTIRGDVIVKEKFTTILGVLQNKIPGLRVIPVMVDNMLRYTIAFNLSTSNREPLLVINGQRYPSTSGIYERIMQISPYDIDFIDVSRFNGAMEFGVPATGGFISIYTKNKEMVGSSGSFNKKYFQTAKVSGYSVPTAFPSPDYSKIIKTDDKVDFRSTIYWNSSLRSDASREASVSFYSADFATRYKIVVEGMTSDHVPFRAEKIIKIEEAR
jgi:CarboxypepD_reg-like domain